MHHCKTEYGLTPTRREDLGRGKGDGFRGEGLQVWALQAFWGRGTHEISLAGRSAAHGGTPVPPVARTRRRGPNEAKRRDPSWEGDRKTLQKG